MKNFEKEREMSHEEMEAHKLKMYEFYKESVDYLQAQLTYEELLSKIDEVRFKRASIQVQMAMMLNQPDEVEEDDLDEMPNVENPLKKRSLKKE